MAATSNGWRILWITGFTLLVGVALYAASHHRKGQNAAGRVIEKRKLRDTKFLELQQTQGNEFDIKPVEFLSEENQDG